MKRRLWTRLTVLGLAGLLACAPGLSPRPLQLVAELVDLPWTDLRPPPAAPVIGSDYLGVCLDTSVLLGGRWWDGAAGSSGGLGTGRATPLNLADVPLRRYLAALAPTILRVGGSEADRVWYGPDRPPALAELSPYRLEAERWTELVDLASSTGARLLFTLNGGPGARDRQGRWQAQNARWLMSLPASQSPAVLGWELGNEPNGYLVIHGWNAQISPTTLATDYGRLRAEAARLSPRWRVVGPATAFWPVWGDFGGFTTGFIQALAQPADVISWHYYPQQSSRGPVASRPASPGQLLDPGRLDEVLVGLRQIERAVDHQRPRPELWLGETGHAQFGGQPGLSDTFLSSLWWLDQAALLASQGVAYQLRQSLIGGDYGLLGPDRSPRPDYWMTLLFKRLFHGRVWRLSLDGTEGRLRAYACQDGAVTRLLLINLAQDRVWRLGPGHQFKRWLCLADPPQSTNLTIAGRPADDRLLEPNGLEAVATLGDGLETPPLSITLAELQDPVQQ